MKIMSTFADAAGLGVRHRLQAPNGRGVEIYIVGKNITDI
jgi:hypothetical protein